MNNVLSIIFAVFLRILEVDVLILESDSALEDLAGMALGQLLQQLDSSWVFIGCNSFLDELSQLLRCSAGSLTEHDDCGHLFSQIEMWNAHHCSFNHIRMGVQDLLNLPGGYTLYPPRMIRPTCSAHNEKVGNVHDLTLACFFYY